LTREIIFYRDRHNESPVEKFLDALPSKAAQKAVWVLQLAEDLDRIPAKYFTKLTGTQDIWEFRISFGSNIYRIFAFQHGKALVLTHGFIKKTQKTPLEEIERAHQHRIDYFKQQGAPHE